jgi:hypothetical protein
VLGPEISVDAYAATGNVDDLLDDTLDREVTRFGLRLSYIASPKTTFRLTGIYETFDYNRERRDFNVLTGRFEMTQRITDHLFARFSYQYRDRDSDQFGDSYYENLFLVSGTYVFD